MGPAHRIAPAARLGALALSLAACAREAPLAPARNVLLITVDTLRADQLGAYGAQLGISPHIDALARGGVVFENAISQSSWTLPAIASLLTSTHPSTHGVDRYVDRLDPSYETLCEILAGAGFATAAVSSHVYVGPRYGMDQGIAEFDDSLSLGQRQVEQKVSSPEVSRRGIAWLEGATQREPRWFLWLHYFDPHYPYVRHGEGGEAIGDTLADYRGEIAFTDRWIGEVLGALERLGAADETLVLLVSDHGEEFREHGKLRHGYTLFREVVHVPLLMRVPGLAPTRVREAVSGVDVLPTLLELLGLPVPETAFGRSLVPAMRGAGLDDEPILSELSLNPDYRSDSLQLGPWKLVRDHTGRSTLGFAAFPGGPPVDGATTPNAPAVEPGERLLLYRIDGDAAELRDVSAEHPDETERLRETLDAVQARARAAAGERSEAIELTPEDLEVIRKLGYAGDDGEGD